MTSLTDLYLASGANSKRSLSKSKSYINNFELKDSCERKSNLEMDCSKRRTYIYIVASNREDFARFCRHAVPQSLGLQVLYRLTQGDDKREFEYGARDCQSMNF
jgi:hypothetical protein